MNGLKNILAKGAMAFIVSLAAVATPQASRADALPAAAPRNAQAANMLYVWGYSRYGLDLAVQSAVARGFAPVGFPRYAYVPEAGRYAWMQNIVFVGY
jgi:hypothetical protein